MHRQESVRARLSIQLMKDRDEFTKELHNMPII